MPNLLSLLRPPSPRANAISLDEYINMLRSFPLPLHQTLTGDREKLDPNFLSYVGQGYQANGVVFACMLTRMMLFSEARFVWQQIRAGRPGDLFGTADLALIENPEPGQTTGDLLASAIVDVDLAGTSFTIRRPGRLKRLRPDWTVIILGSERSSDSPVLDIDAEIIGFGYQPGGPGSGEDMQTFLAEEVALFAPIKDPLARYRGTPTITAVRRDVMADSAMTSHKHAFLANAATPNLVVKFEPNMTREQADAWIELFEQEHAGVLNAYRTAYLGGGMSIEAVGKDFQQLEFKATQGAGETRIVAAFGLHPTIVPMSEGLAGSSLNSGNFAAARRLIADKTLRPLWKNFAGSMQRVLPPPPGSRLWYDARDIPFLAEDIKDAAEVLGREANAIRTLTDGGFAPDSVVNAVTSGDLTRLQHAGYLPVQVQPIKPEDNPDSDDDEFARAVAYQRIYEPMGGITLPRPVGDVRARETFWALSGPAQGLHVDRDTVLTADHAIVRLFPSRFELAA